MWWIRGQLVPSMSVIKCVVMASEILVRIVIMESSLQVRVVPHASLILIIFVWEVLQPHLIYVKSYPIYVVTVSRRVVSSVMMETLLMGMDVLKDVKLKLGSLAQPAPSTPSVFVMRYVEMVDV